MANKTINVRRVVCRAHHFHWVRGLLIVQLRRDIPIKEFGGMLGYKKRYTTYLSTGGQVGGRGAVRRLINLAREHGIVIHLSDFYDDDPNLESERIWRPWSNRKV